MPVTPFQSEVLGVLAGNRSEESHFAGGLVLNASPESARYSHDFDIFQETAAQVSYASETDAASLLAAGFAVEPKWPWEKAMTYRKAVVSRGGDSVEVDWAADSAFRFFPIERDPMLGWRLSLFDMATNKALALSARTETRDYVDIVELHDMFPLPAICWAACGKDPGFSPLSLLKMMRRFARIDPVTLDEISARNLDPRVLKEAWIEMSDYAEAEMERIANHQPDLPIGIAFVDSGGYPRWLDHPGVLTPHFPCVRGCLPKVILE
jgi:hypothetical protein